MYLIIVIIILIDRKSAFDEFLYSFFLIIVLGQFVSLKYVFVVRMQLKEVDNFLPLISG